MISNKGLPDLTIEDEKPKKPRLWVRILVSVFMAFVIVAVSLIAYYLYQISAPAAKSDEQKIIEIPVGSKLEAIADILHGAGLIRDEKVFIIYAKTGPARGVLKPGPYALKPNMNIVQITSYLHAGKIATKTITFPEGITIDQMADRYEKMEFGAKGEFLDATKQEYNYSFLENRPSSATLEGYLFPDTYTLKITATPRDLIDEMLKAFEQKAWPRLGASKAGGLSPFELLTLASIVESEASKDEDRKMIAGIFYNRLDRGMKLESDVTIRYVTGRKQVTAADLQIDSPYNSYKTAGLPPGPICNPSLLAIEAVLNPAQTDNLFFAADKNNIVYYAKTYQEHQENIKKYLQ